MNYRCPNCHTIFEGEMERCPNCGVKLRFNQTTNNSNKTTAVVRKPNTRNFEQVSNVNQRTLMNTKTYFAIRIKQIDEEIKKQERDKGAGVVLIIISIFALWPLIIVGIIQINHSNKRIAELQQEKQTIVIQMSENYY